MVLSLLSKSLHLWQTGLRRDRRGNLVSIIVPYLYWKTVFKHKNLYNASYLSVITKWRQDIGSFHEDEAGCSQHLYLFPWVGITWMQGSENCIFFIAVYNMIAGNVSLVLVISDRNTPFCLCGQGANKREKSTCVKNKMYLEECVVLVNILRTNVKLECFLCSFVL